MGAGSIGCFVGGRLMAAGEEVVLVGRERLGREIGEHGLTVSDCEAETRRVAAGEVRYSSEARDLAGCDVVLCCVKSAQTSEVARELAGIVRPDALVVSLQNGVSNPDRLREHLGQERVVPAIVGFNVVAQGGGRFHRGTTGPLMVGRAELRGPLAALRATGLEIETHADLVPHQWTKLIVNLNNAVSALSGAPTQELLARPGYRKVIAAVVREALSVLRVAGISPAALRGVPLAVMPMVLRLPTPLVRLVTRRQIRADAEARSSMWEDLERRRSTEVDDLNGAIVGLADRVGAEAPLNRRIVALVHEAERRGDGSPGLGERELWRAVHAPT
jgi:2-dehydropantoate 2-reductase